MIIGIQPISSTMLELLDKHNQNKDNKSNNQIKNETNNEFETLFQAELEKLRNNG